jgi:hypothetical protein
MLQKITLAGLVLLLTPLSSRAQGVDLVGNRAAGLGAFVAVADDASAVVWNPAGLVFGPIFNVSLDIGTSRRTPGEVPVAGERAGRSNAALVAFGVPPLGASYYRLESVGLDASGTVGGPSPGRQQEQVSFRKLTTHHLGVTVLQSLGDYVTVGATAKVVRGVLHAGRLEVPTWDEGFDRAEVGGSRGATAGDLDLGAMVARGRLRAGVVVRNLTTPRFEFGSESRELARHARVGAAWGDRWPGLTSTVVAFDVDVTKVTHPDGDRRDVAAGVERWLPGRRVGLRGGVRASTVGEVRPIVTGGGSFAVRAGTYVDAFVAGGASGARAWGVGARVTY